MTFRPAGLILPFFLMVLLASCNPTVTDQETEIFENVGGAGLLHIRSIDSITLIDPTSSPNNDDTPTIRVSPTRSIDTIFIYSDSSCTDVLTQQSGSEEFTDITIPSLTMGSYTFYAKRKWPDRNTSSVCSSVSLSYEYLGARITGSLANNTTPTQSKNWSWGCTPIGNCETRYVINTSPTHSFTVEVYGATTTASQAVGDGTYYIHLQARVTSAPGNVSEVESYSAILDNTPPNITGLSDDATPVNSVTWNFTCDEATACTWQYLIDQTAVNSPSGAYSATSSVTKNTGDGTFYLHLQARDLAGNESSVDHYLAVLDTTDPVPTGLTDSSTPVQSVTWNWGCTDVNTCTYRYVIDQSAVTTPTGAYSATTSDSQLNGDGTYYLHLQILDGAGNESSVYHYSAVLDNTPPTLVSTIINDGDTHAGTIFAQVKVQATDTNTTTHIRLANTTTASCQDAYADDNWQAYTTDNVVQSFGHTIIAGDGTKTVCAWAKDTGGNITVTTPVSGTLGVDMDTIIFEIGNPPVIEQFDVHNGSSGTTFALNDPVYIDFEVTDAEGLDNNPISIYYTTDNVTWTPVVEDHGGLTGNPTSFVDSYNSFLAPTASYFRMKMVATDSAGNTSVPSESAALNTGNWSVYAGTTDSGVGGSATSLKLSSGYILGQSTAVNPLNNDVYAISYGVALYKLDAQTGKTEVFIKHGNTNLVDGQTLDANSRIQAGKTMIAVDSNGYIYLNSQETGGASYTSIIWQINPETKMVRKYAGGGTLATGAMNPDTVALTYTQIAFGEDDTLYAFSRCDYDEDASLTTTEEIMAMIKISQNATTKLAENVTHIAGNCSATTGSPTAGEEGANPLTNPLLGGSNQYNYMVSIAAWEQNNVNVILYCGIQDGCYKILDGQTYHSNLTTKSTGLYYQYSTGKLYYSEFNGSTLNEGSIDETGTDGDANLGIVVSGSGAGACQDDGIDPINSCSIIGFGPYGGPNGTLAFNDGSKSNFYNIYRVRYIDQSGLVQTYLGSPRFYGDGLNKGLIRGDFSGIYYKKATEPNQGLFGEGLYFLDKTAMVMGKIDPATNVATLLWGNQTNLGSPDTASDISTSNSMGGAYTGGNAHPITFDSQGLPFVRASNRLYKVETDYKPDNLTPGSTLFHLAQTGHLITNYWLYVNGGVNNFTMKDNGLFVIGQYVAGDSNTSPELKYFNFDTGLITHIMGDVNVPPTFSPDDNTGGNLADKTFDGDFQGYLRLGALADSTIFPT